MLRSPANARVCLEFQPTSWELSYLLCVLICPACEAALFHTSFHRAPVGSLFRLTHVGKCTRTWCPLANFRSHMMHGCTWRCVLLCFPCNIFTREGICRRCASQGGIPGIRSVSHQQETTEIVWKDVTPHISGVVWRKAVVPARSIRITVLADTSHEVASKLS